MRAARVCALAAVRVSFLACVRTRRPVVFDGVVAVVERRADGLRAAVLRAAGLRLAAAGFFAAAFGVLVVEVVVVVVSSAMLGIPPALRFGFKFGISVR